ncbi:MAG: hypothetical protein ACLR94_08255 [Acutalibacteraceae bacterium]
MGKEKSPARGLRAEALGVGVTLQKERQKGTAAPTRKTPTASRSAERAFTSEQRRHSVIFCAGGAAVRTANARIHRGMADCYKIDTGKESYYNEKSYILISQNVAFNLFIGYKKDIFASLEAGIKI